MNEVAIEPAVLVAALLAAIIVWRLFYLAAHEPPAARAMALSPIPARRWFPSRKDRLEIAIELVRTETDHLLAQTDAAKASAGLAQARANLTAILRELEPCEPNRAVLAPSQPALTLSEIEPLLDLLQLPAEQQRRLSALIAARIEENAR